MVDLTALGTIFTALSGGTATGTAAPTVQPAIDMATLGTILSALGQQSSSTDPTLQQQSQAASDEMTRQYLGEHAKAQNILNYKGANTAYLDALHVAKSMGQDVFETVKNNVTPYPGPQAAITYAPVIGQPPTPPVSTPPAPTKPILASAPVQAGMSMAKKAVIAAAIASTGLGSGAAGWFLNKAPTPVPTVPAVTAPVPADEVEVF